MLSRSARSLPDILLKAAKPLVAPIVSLLFPQECALCGGNVTELRSGTICEDCWSQTHFFDAGASLCEKCGQHNFNANASHTARCGRCETHMYERAFSLGPYELGLRKTIIALKSKPHLPEIVVDRIKERLESFPDIGYDLIIPVPLSKQRRLERGFNQAEVIADLVARSTQRAVDRFSLQRKKDTRMHRAGMDQKAREKTVENAFEVVRPKIIAGKNVIVIDDVFTSGATASACAASLIANGAKRATVFTIAKAEFRRI